jgi:hypothetical protein
MLAAPIVSANALVIAKANDLFEVSMIIPFQ